MGQINNLDDIFEHAVNDERNALVVHIVNEYNIENLRNFNTVALEQITKYLCQERANLQEFNGIFDKFDKANILISDKILFKLKLNGYVDIVDRIMAKGNNLEQPSIFKLIYNGNIEEIEEHIFWNGTGLEDIIRKCVEINNVKILKILHKRGTSINIKQRCRISRQKMVAIDNFKMIKYLIRLGAPFYTEVANKYTNLVKDYKFITEKELERNKLPSLEVIQILIDKIWSKEIIYSHAVLENRDDILKFFFEPSGNTPSLKTISIKPTTEKGDRQTVGTKLAFCRDGPPIIDFI
jgi:hypothetical protein